jgi:hypothetical protein
MAALDNGLTMAKRVAAGRDPLADLLADLAADVRRP